MKETIERFEKVRVADVMVPLADYPKVSVDATLGEALEVIEGAVIEVGGRTSIPRLLLVFEDEVLVGTVRRRDLMRGLEPSFLVSRPLYYRKQLFRVEVDSNLSELSYDRVVRGVKEQALRPVSEVIRPIEYVVQHGDHLIKAVYEMVSHNRSLLPVMKEGEVVGVVRSLELCSELALLAR